MIACICGGVVEGCLICTVLSWLLAKLLSKRHQHNCKCQEKKCECEKGKG